MEYTLSDGTVYNDSINPYAYRGAINNANVNKLNTVDSTQVKTELPNSVVISNNANPGYMPPPEQGGLAELWSNAKSFFTPQEGQKTSIGNNMMDALGTGIQAGTGLASMYLTNKTNKVNQALTERKLANEEKQAKYLKSIDAGNTANKQAFAKNLGGGASYVGLA